MFFIEKILSKYYWNFRLVLDDHLTVAITRVTIGDWTWDKKNPRLRLQSGIFDFALGCYPQVAPELTLQTLALQGLPQQGLVLFLEQCLRPLEPL